MNCGHICYYVTLQMFIPDSRSEYVKTILLISIVLFPKYFIITKSGINTIVLTDFVYYIFR